MAVLPGHMRCMIVLDVVVLSLPAASAFSQNPQVIAQGMMAILCARPTRWNIHVAQYQQGRSFLFHFPCNTPRSLLRR
jgi:hypothetical protein